MIPGSLSLENVGLRGTQVILFPQSSPPNTIPPKKIFSSGTLIMCMGAQCIPVEIRRCPGYAKNILPKNADSLFPELKAGQKQVFDCGGDDEQGAPCLHAHPCP